jgi:RecB family exonuclease
VSILRLPPAGEVPPIQAFADARQEIAWALAEIAALLDRGVEAGDIALSVGDLPALEPALRRQAELLEVPLAVRLSRPLAQLPPCRVFERLRACLDTGFRPESLRDLLLDGSLPWRSAGRGRDLLELASEQRVLKNLPGSNRWERALRRAGGRNPAGLRAYYRRLDASLRRIAGAPDFRRLKEELTAFSKGLLDPSAWARSELAVWQFALDTLDDLEEARSAAGGLPAAPFRLWLRYLADTRYGLPVPEAGVNTYRYGVSAGIAPACHFVIGASQAATRWVVKKLPGLGSHEEAALGEVEHDLSDTRLALYARSGGEVRFSYARRGFHGSNLPPGFFVAAGAVREAGPCPPHPDELEEQLWLGGPAPSSPPLPLQQAGFRRALSAARAPKALDLTRSPLAQPQLLARTLSPLRNEAGLLSVSATTLEKYLGCPFRFLLERLLGLEERDSSPLAVEPMEFGQLMHRVLQAFHNRVRRLEPEARLAPERREVYRSWMAHIVRRVFRAWQEQEPTPVTPAWREARRQAEKLAGRFLEVELEKMSGARVQASERFLRAPRPEAGVLLRGKIDRLSELEGELLLTDYKTGTVPARARIFGERPDSFQMPFYVALLRAAGMPVGRAAYYAVRKARYVWVLGGLRSMADGQAMEQALQRLEQAVSAMAAALGAGDFTVPRTCATCGSSGICRARFTAGETHGHPLR